MALTDRYNISITGHSVPEEIYNVTGTGDQTFGTSTRKRGVYESTLEIWTGAGGTGTQLAVNTDYKFIDQDSYYSGIGTETVYTGWQLVNTGAYNGVDLYFNYTTIGTYFNKDQFEPTYEAFTTSKAIANSDEVNILNFDLSASGAITCTLPNAILRTNEKITIIGTGGSLVNTLTMATISAQTIGGIVAGTWQIQGTGKLEVISNGATWEVLSYTDKISIADSGSDTDRVVVKYADGTGKITGHYDPGTYDINTPWGTVANMNISAFDLVTYGYTCTSVHDGNISSFGTDPIPAFVYSVTVSTMKIIYWYPQPLTSRTDDYGWSLNMEWR